MLGFFRLNEEIRVKLEEELEKPLGVRLQWAGDMGTLEMLAGKENALICFCPFHTCQLKRFLFLFQDWAFMHP